MLLMDLLTDYARKRPNVEQNSIKLIAYTANNFQLFLARPPETSDLTEENILDHLRWNAEKKRSPRTCNHHRGNLLTLWNFAAESKLISCPPRIAKRKEPQRDPVAWSLTEIARLYSATELLEGYYPGIQIPKSLIWKIAIAIAWDTAVRIEAIAQAEVRDVNLETGVWICRAETIKGKRADEIKTLHANTINLINQSLIGQRRKLWPFPWSKCTATRHLGKLLELAGLPNDRKHKFHCLRRTAESHAANSMGIEWAARAVGHSVEVARKHYISQAICQPPALIDALPRPF